MAQPEKRIVSLIRVNGVEMSCRLSDEELMVFLEDGLGAVEARRERLIWEGEMTNRLEKAKRVIKAVFGRGGRV